MVTIDLRSASPEEGRQPSAKRARLDDGGAVRRQQLAARQGNDAGDKQAPTREMQFREMLRWAERVPDPRICVAWSSTNCVAMTGPLISITSMHKSEVRCYLVLPEGQVVTSMAFSPRGDALAAILAPSGATCVYIRRGLCLNRWIMTEYWPASADQSDRPVALQWLAERRRQRLKSKKDADDPALLSRKLAARGPQFINTDGLPLLLATVSERGSVIIAQGAAKRDAKFRCTKTQLQLGDGERLSQAAFGLVANEPVLLLAYATPLHAEHEHSSRDTSRRADSIHLAQITVQIASSELSAPSVACSPIGDAALTAPPSDGSTAATGIVEHMVWIDVNPSTADDNGSNMNLVCAFDGIPSKLRSWSIRRQDKSGVSPAFSTFQSAETATSDNESTGWMAETDRSSIAPLGHKIHTLVTSPVFPSLAYVTFDKAPEADKSDLKKALVDRKVVVIHGENLEVIKSCDVVMHRFSSMALSPHGAMMAWHGEALIKASHEILSGYDVRSALHCAVLDEDDCQDLASYDTRHASALKEQTTTSTKERIANTLRRAVTKAHTYRSRRADNVICELQNMLRGLDSALDASSILSSTVAYRPECIWQVTEYLEFTIRLAEQLACQAIVASVSGHPVAPSAEGASTASAQRATHDEGDFVAILTRTLHAKWLALVTHRLIGFVNWLNKAASETIPDGKNSQSGRTPKHQHRKLQACQTRVAELLAQSNIDMSGFARACHKLARDLPQPTKSTPDQTAERGATPSAPDHAQRERVADILQQSGAIRSVFRLVCPPDQYDITPLAAEFGTGISSNDIRESFPRYSVAGQADEFDGYYLCLGCYALHRFVHSTPKYPCLCRASAWWAVKREMMQKHKAVHADVHLT